MRRKRRICFVTGTRAEFGLMDSVLRAIDSHPLLELQTVVTGMHLSQRHGRTVDSLGRKIDATVPWRCKTGSPVETAQSTGMAIAKLAAAFDRLASDVVLIVGDRVEAFAAASAAHISSKIIAHVHGGDRAMGQVDDSLRHAITKLSHLHFAATEQSAQRIAKLGEDAWRIFQAGAPGIDGIRTAGGKKRPLSPALSLSTTRLRSLQAGRGSKCRFALLVLHPIEANDLAEYHRAKLILNAVRKIPFDRIVVIHPNNDPGSRGIARCWEENRRDERISIHRNIDRPHFLQLMRDAAVLVGNSSSGIIEAASFGTPVIDIGPRQLGRERSENVTNVPYRKAPLAKVLKSIWNGGKPRKRKIRNVYGGDGAGVKIAKVLSFVALSDKLRRKLIAY